MEGGRERLSYLQYIGKQSRKEFEESFFIEEIIYLHKLFDLFRMQELWEEVVIDECGNHTVIKLLAEQLIEFLEHRNDIVNL